MHHYKKTLKIIAGILIFYAAIGFLLVPSVAKIQLKKIIQSKLSVNAEIEKIYFNPFIFEAEITNLKIPSTNEQAAQKNRLDLGRLNIDLQIFPLLKKEIRLKSFMLGNANVDFTIFSDGKTNWETKEETAPETPSGRKPWILRFDRINIENVKLDFSDRTHREPLDLPLGPIYFSATNISTVLDSTTSLKEVSISYGEKGIIQLSGAATLKPLTANVGFKIIEMPLEFLSAYLSDTTILSVKGGTLDTAGTLDYKSANIQMSANANISNLNLTDLSTKKSVISWGSLGLQNLVLKTSPLQVRIDEVNLNKFDGSIILRKDGVLNFKEFMRTNDRAQAKNSKKSDKVAEAKKPAAPKKTFDVLVEKFVIADSRLFFSDQTLRPNFSAQIDNLNGVFSPATSELNKKIDVALSGRVEAQGKFKSKGFFVFTESKPNLNLDVNFGNIEMTTFTPYSGKFAGYEISKGKLFLNLNYTLQRNRIKGKNDVLLDQFTLGRRVESKDATHLPVKLALALLKDRKGKIKFNLPVEGDINSPKFSFGKLIFTALKNLIINVVAAPFDFLKKVLGDGDNLDLVFFNAGTSVLAPDQQAKIQKIAEALVERPGLVIEVQGSYQPVDIVSLQKTKKKKASVSDEELRALAIMRGHLVQKALVAANVEAERVFLLGATKFDKDDKAPRSVLTLKAR